MKPKFSLITVCLNAESTIADTLESVVMQTFTDFEHIIMDGGSNDKTLICIHDFMVSHPEYSNRVKLYEQSNSGMYQAINQSIGLASGEYIGLLHADDMFRDKYAFESISQALTRDGIQGVYSNLVYVSKVNCDRTVRRWYAGQLNSRSLYLGWMLPHPTLYLSASLYSKIGFYREDLPIAADYEFIIRLLMVVQRNDLCYLDQYTVAMRLGGVSNRLTSLATIFVQDFAALRMNGVGVLLSCWIVLVKKIRKLIQFFGIV